MHCDNIYLQLCEAPYSGQDQTVHFAHITSLWTEVKPRALQTQEVSHQAMKYCHWEIMFIVLTVYNFLSDTPPIPLIPLPYTSNKHEMQGFILSAVLQSHTHIHKL